MSNAIITALDHGWVLHQGRRSATAPEIPPVAASVPGCVHTDLLAHGLIPDPFAGINEADVAWVADCDWRYTCDLDVTEEQLAHDNVELKFNGLDTLAAISVNGESVADTQNMHRRYRFNVKRFLQPGSNQLEIGFRSATRYCDQVRDAEGEWPSSSFGRPFNYLRKMACSWGWDWGPWLTTAGIWRPASLEAWSFGRLSDIRPHVTVDDDDRGHVYVDVDYLSGAPVSKARIRSTLRDPEGIVVATATEPAVVGTTVVELDPGIVRRWWPHTMGDQPLYELTVDVLCPDDVLHASKQIRVGFRSIELDTSPDATGAAFTFVVNGVPMFVRGVNWIPDDVFVSRITPERYRERIEQAIDAHVDMLRVWGGGIYEDDGFYEICDELGVLVWQDFLFACAAYPEHLLADEVEAEAFGNVSRLMHHASLAVWNGNNENIWGYADWGWKDVLDDREWGATFYHEVLPRVCAEVDPLTPYWPGSPWSGTDAVHPNADAHGCIHAWDVWNQIDLERYRDRTPRFVSEFGWQAPPSVRTLEEYISADQLNRQSPAWLNHQKADQGDLKLDRGIESRFGRVVEFEAFCYAAHVVQARAIQTGIEHFRSLRPYCMGTIWWQLNDCWPVTSWAVIDGRQRRKPAWYALRDAYRSRLITIQPRGGRLVAVAINETNEPWTVATTASRRRFDGSVLAESSIDLVVAPRCAATHVIASDVADPVERSSEVLVVGDGDGRAWWWYDNDRSLDLTPPTLTTSAHREDGDLVLSVTTDAIVRDLTIYPERVEPSATVDRQLVNLLPGETTEFRLTGVSDTDVDALMRQPALWNVAAALP